MMMDMTAMGSGMILAAAIYHLAIFIFAVLGIASTKYLLVISGAALTFGVTVIALIRRPEGERHVCDWRCCATHCRRRRHRRSDAVEQANWVRHGHVSRRSTRTAAIAIVEAYQATSRQRELVTA